MPYITNVSVAKIGLEQHHGKMKPNFTENKMWKKLVRYRDIAIFGKARPV